jgi:hypothetical protein
MVYHGHVRISHQAHKVNFGSKTSVSFKDLEHVVTDCVRRDDMYFACGTMCASVWQTASLRSCKSKRFTLPRASTDE